MFLTGAVTDVITGSTTRDTSNDGFYGVEFSPDSHSLYATTIATTSASHNYLYRYNAIPTLTGTGSRTQINDYGTAMYTLGALQLGPDGTIYIARRNQQFLDVLPSPNTPGAGWTSAAHLSLASGAQSLLGLPAVVAGNFSCASMPTPSPTPSPDPCCPPWNQNQLINSLFFDHSGSFAAPYTVHFAPSLSFNSQMQTYINYLNSMNSAISKITIAWGLHNQGTGNNPNVPLGPQIPNLGNPSAFTTWTSGGIGNPTIVGADPNFFTLPTSHPMVIGTCYRVHTGMYLENGQKFFPDNCAVVDINFRIQTQSMRRNEPPVLEISDGKSIIKRLPIKPKTQ